MPRLISMRLTQHQILDQTKTVTRRTGWQKLKPGTILQPVLKAMGLKKGEQVTLLGGPIEVTEVWREPLYQISDTDVQREGFPDMGSAEFVEFICQQLGCTADTTVTRIGFRYL